MDSLMRSLDAVVGPLDRFVAESRAQARPVIRQEPLGALIDELGLERWVREGGLGGEALTAFTERYLHHSTALHSPAYMAHQVSAPNLVGSMAGLLDGVTNNAMSIYEMGPASSAIEFFMVNWMLEKVGWTPAPANPGMAVEGEPCGGGVLTHGGSLANLTALIAARNHAAPEAWDEGAPADLALMAPAGAHYSVSRAAGILGIGRKGVSELEVDVRGAIVADRLPAALARLRDAGKRPFALVANMCSTAVGIYDPLAEVAAFCREAGIWLHVDGAHGAGALLSPRRRSLFEGVRLADSLVWDAHKMMQAPILCAAVLVRDHRTLDRAFQQEASYLFHDKDQPGVDFGRRSFECTKAGLGLRAYMALGALGEEAMGDYVDRQCDLALAAHDLISATPGFECAVRPESCILCFRVEGDDALQISVRNAILADGRFYLSSAMVNGRRWLRIVLLNPAIEIAHIQALVAEVGRKAECLRM